MAAENTKALLLEGLDCANCAAKIEQLVNSLGGVKSATLNIITRTLLVELKDITQTDLVYAQIRDIVSRTEPDIELVPVEHLRKLKRANDNDNSKIIRLMAGALLFALALLFNFPFWAKALIYCVSYLLVGGKILLQAGRNILRGRIFDENFLMSIATLGAFAVGEFPEGVAVMLFYQVGEYFQGLAVDRSRRSISALMDIRPDYANLQLGSELKKVAPEDVTVGEIIVVKPGEKIPLDGQVIAGTSMVDTSALTGESIPREVGENSEVLGGFINKNGLLSIKVSKQFGESTVAKILDLVQNAGSKKAPTENFITKFARYYTPVVVLTAAVLAIIPPLLIPGAAFSLWIYRALIFLVISCPCALVVSIPLSFFGGIGAASRQGILVKGGNYLEGLNNVETVVFDKTGTLTKGVFTVTNITSFAGMSKEDLLEYAAYAESFSNHPIATSILKEYAKPVQPIEIENYEEKPGYGIQAKVHGKLVQAGNYRLMESEKIPCPEVDSAGTVIHVAISGQYAGYIVISDELKDDAVASIRELKKLGIGKTVMLTGDSKLVGAKVGTQLGVDEVHGELLPDQKVMRLEVLEKEKSPKGKVAFVGDGINDAPVLARADIGIAMGGLGSDAAIEAADIVILTDEPSKLGTAIKIAKRTKSIVWQNIGFAMGVKVLALILGAAGIATMWEAVFADVGVTLIAVFNSMRVMRLPAARPAKW